MLDREIEEGGTSSPERPSTALFDVDLGVNFGGKDRRDQKRYQVTAMGARPGGG